METMHYFLSSSQRWISQGKNNLLLIHCERGGWPVLAFMVSALLIYMKLYSGEQRTLDMLYKHAPHELLQLFSPLNPMPSQLRYLKYVSRSRFVGQWPPPDSVPLTLDCVMFRFIPNFDGEGGCRPVFRVYGKDPSLDDQTPKHLFSTSKKIKPNRAKYEIVKIDINCPIQGDVVVECTHLNEDMHHEEMMFRIMFNINFIIGYKVLMLNRDEIDTPWDAKDLFPKKFKMQLIFPRRVLPLARLIFLCLRRRMCGVSKHLHLYWSFFLPRRILPSALLIFLCLRRRMCCLSKHLPKSKRCLAMWIG